MFTEYEVSITCSIDGKTQYGRVIREERYCYRVLMHFHYRRVVHRVQKDSKYYTVKRIN
jgi:hypothetical protein